MNPSYAPPSQQPTTLSHRPESALEIMSPRIVERLCTLWGTPEVEQFISGLLLDSRDGQRQGFPLEVAHELLMLIDLSIAKRAIVAAQITGEPYRKVFRSMRAHVDQVDQDALNPFSTPAQSAASALEPSQSISPSPRPRRPTPPPKKSWWKKLFG